MKYSESRKHLAPALIKVQGQIKNVLKTKQNEFLNTSYIDLPTLLNYVRPILNDNGFSLIQGNEGDQGEPAVTTCLMHTSGEYVETVTTAKMVFSTETFEEMALDKTNYLQKFGGQITYMRRYAILSILGIGAEDLDGSDMTPKEAEERAEKFRITMGLKKEPTTGAAPEKAKVNAREKTISFAERIEKLSKDLKQLLVRAGADTPVKVLGIMRLAEWDERIATKECLKRIKGLQKKGPRGPHPGLETMTPEHAAVLDKAIAKHSKNIKRNEKKNHAKA